jgi:hypothetical protein
MLEKCKEYKRASCRYITINDWLLNQRDLTSTEKLIIAHIMGFGASGCWKSSNEFARYIGIDRGTFIRAYLNLVVNKKWIVVLHDTHKERVLFINDEMLENLPLLKGQNGCGKPVKSGRGASGETPPGALQNATGGSGETPPPLYRTEEISYKKLEKKEIKEIIGACAEMTKNRAGGRLSESEFQRRRQKMIGDLCTRTKMYKESK